MVLKIHFNQLPLGKLHLRVCFLGNQPKEIGAKSGLKKQTSVWGSQAGPPAKWLIMQTPPWLLWRMNNPPDVVAIQSLIFTSGGQELRWSWKKLGVGMAFSLDLQKYDEAVIVSTVESEALWQSTH